MTKAPYKYANFAQKLLRRIVLDRMKPGDRLPTEEDLVKEHGLSRITIRRALFMLERDGFVLRKRRLGTFVAKSPKSIEDMSLVRGTAVIVIPHLASNSGAEDHALSSAMRGIEDTLAHAGFAVHILSVGRDEAQDRIRLHRLLEHSHVEGICVIGSCFDRYAELIGDIPLVNSCTFVPGRIPWVGIDMGEVAHKCIGHLLDCGHRNIATIIGPWVDPRAVAMMSRGHQQAFEEHSASFRRTMIHQAYEEHAIVELVQEVLQTEPCPTALFAEDWRITRGVLVAAAAMGVRIPEDLSLVGCGQNNLYFTSPVAITAYVPNNEQVGRDVARVLLDMLDGRARPSEPVFVPGELLERDSVLTIASPSTD